ncbi:hypothetical protein BJ508DRAFT_183004 [Ascobolus immersus RN42]|uniref:Uncharacterized protein n=1 Tax=Ascobolus immersus RN42 TaxID=1160509 RepID=A0A3N4HRW3_ASCIM|nr:hypothetical protein BJ508DRAFT_183004 [Ascobolus immersus RN42]
MLDFRYLMIRHPWPRHQLVSFSPKAPPSRRLTRSTTFLFCSGVSFHLSPSIIFYLTPFLSPSTHLSTIHHDPRASINPPVPPKRAIATQRNFPGHPCKRTNDKVANRALNVHRTKGTKGRAACSKQQATTTNDKPADASSDGLILERFDHARGLPLAAWLLHQMKGNKLTILWKTALVYHTSFVSTVPLSDEQADEPRIRTSRTQLSFLRGPPQHPLHHHVHILRNLPSTSSSTPPVPTRQFFLPPSLGPHPHVHHRHHEPQPRTKRN